jgi:hypothetical protein
MTRDGDTHYSFEEATFTYRKLIVQIYMDLQNINFNLEEKY